jgi:hypothetical protein
MFGCTRSIPSQSSVPAGLALASDSGFCFQCQAGSSLVLCRPIEITAFIRSFETIVAAISGEETLLAICTLERTEECDAEGKVRKPDRQGQIP